MFEALDAVLLARIQFAFTVSFHIIFPAFSIGLASYLMVLEGHEEYRLHINPSDKLSEAQKNYLTAQHKLFKTWYQAWSAKL